MVDITEQQIPILSRLRPPKGAVHKKHRKGRGPGSGLGKTAGRGQKGQHSRSGSGKRIGFEGGQMPLQRRLPKIGFHNPFSKNIVIVNVGSLNKFEADSVVDADLLIKKRLIDKRFDGIKVLGNGELDRALTIRVHAVSGTARMKIEKAGGRVEIIGPSASDQQEEST